jgi:hypothetical protein
MDRGIVKCSWRSGMREISNWGKGNESNLGQQRNFGGSINRDVEHDNSCSKFAS